jgi:DivIVA domain-containing protein
VVDYGAPKELVAMGGAGTTSGAERRVTVALTPDEIEGREFRVVDQGYDRVQVDAFITEVAASYRYAVHNLLPGASGVGQSAGRHPSASAAENLTRVGQDVAEMLRSAEKIAETLQAEAEAEASSVRAAADVEAAELRQGAERDREQAKRLLVHAQEQADAIVAEAEEQARERLKQADEEATERAEELLSRSQRHAEQILRAERAVIERLHAVRGDVDLAIDRVAGSEERPVLDLTSGEPVLRVGGLPAGDDDEVPAPDPPTEGDADPLRTMIRQAVRRAGEAGEAGAADDVAGNGEPSDDDSADPGDTRHDEAGQPAV